MASSTANDANIRVEESRSRTNFRVTKFSHTWTISNFSFCEKKVGECLTSVAFPFTGNQEHNTIQWCMNFYPKGETEKYKESVSFFMKPLATKKSEVMAMLVMSIVDANGVRRTIQSEQKTNKYIINEERGWSDFVTQNYLLDKTNGLMQGDDLVLFCEIKVLTDISNTSEYLSVIQNTEPKSHPLAKIGHLFEAKKFSDVTITACGKEFQAHKIILAQSPVFAAMFDHDMEEKKQSRIDIIDIDDEVVNEMLHFLYTGKVKNIQETAVGLLAAAEKYVLEDLKIMCEEALHTSLTIENAADTLILADLHQGHQLKRRVISFICFHAADVVTTAGFKSMVLSHASLFAEVFCVMALNKNGDTYDVSETDAAASE